MSSKGKRRVLEEFYNKCKTVELKNKKKNRQHKKIVNNLIKIIEFYETDQNLKESRHTIPLFQVKSKFKNSSNIPTKRIKTFEKEIQSKLKKYRQEPHTITTKTKNNLCIGYLNIKPYKIIILDEEVENFKQELEKCIIGNTDRNFRLNKKIAESQIVIKEKNSKLSIISEKNNFKILRENKDFLDVIERNKEKIQQKLENSKRINEKIKQNFKKEIVASGMID